MKLSADEQSALFGLCVSSARPEPHHPKLAKLGLAVIAQGKFGEYVYVTQKGLTLARTIPHKIELEADWIDRHMSGALQRLQDSLMRSDRGARAASTERGVKSRARTSSTSAGNLVARAPCATSLGVRGSRPAPRTPGAAVTLSARLTAINDKVDARTSTRQRREQRRAPISKRKSK